MEEDLKKAVIIAAQDYALGQRNKHHARILGGNRKIKADLITAVEKLDEFMKEGSKDGVR